MSSRINNRISPYERAKLQYQLEPCARTFEADLELHLKYGYVICTPHLFLMGRPVSKDSSSALILDPCVPFEKPDCWHIWLAVGNLAEFFAHEPRPLPWFSWERNNILRFWPRERLKNLCLHMPSTVSREWTLAPGPRLF